MSYLLDTNVISEFANPAPNLSVQTWLHEHQSQGLYLSVITVGELQQGITRLPLSKKRDQLFEWLQKRILEDYRAFILPIDTDTMIRWGELTGKLMQKGQKMSVMDSLIAASALQYKLNLVTRNQSDFVNTGLTVVNPWQN